MDIKAALQVVGFISFFLISPSYAENGDLHDHSRARTESTIGAEIKPNQVIMEVHGIVCSFCSQGVKKKLAKFDFIDRTLLNEGILMDVENQRITVAVVSGQEPDVQGMFAAVLSGGYEPIQALVADGEGNTSTINAEKKQ